MRKQGIGLEHQADAALVGRCAGDIRSVDDDAPAGRCQETGDRAHRCGLAATRRPEKRDQLALPDVQVEIRHGHGRAVGKGQVGQGNKGIRHSEKIPKAARQ